MPLVSLFQSTPAMRRRSFALRASRSTMEAMVTMSESECVELAIWGAMVAMCCSKFCRIARITVSSVALGRKK